MNTPDDTQKLQALRPDGTLSDDEFAKSKAAVLAGSSVPSDPLSTEDLAEQLASARCQIELMRIDQEWDRERRNYLVYVGGSDRIVPTTLKAWAYGLLGMLIGVVMIIVDFESKNSFLTMLGIVTITISIAFGACLHFRAQAYAILNREYEQRRAMVRSERH